MDVMQKAARIAELLRTKQDAEAEIHSLISGEPQKQRAVQKCSSCGQEGHTARTCTVNATGSKTAVNEPARPT